jgi:hypothetical protein
MGRQHGLRQNFPTFLFNFNYIKIVNGERIMSNPSDNFYLKDGKTYE